MCSPDIFLGLLALLFPPLPVWVRRGLCSVDSLLNILLCMLGYVPGLLHAWYIIAKFPEPASYDYESPDDAEGHVYVFVHDRAGGRRPVPRPAQQQPRPQQPPAAAAAAPQGQEPQAPQSPNYGTAGSAPLYPPQESGVASSSNDAPPPSYAQVIAGDNKIQTQD